MESESVFLEWKLRRNMIIMCLACISLLPVLAESRTNWHSSQVALKELYSLQNDHFNVFKEYLESELKRLEELKK